jgi:PAS domain S-box-containing protein
MGAMPHETMETQAHSDSERLKALLAHRDREIAVLRQWLSETRSGTPASNVRAQEGELNEARAENADLRRANAALVESEAALTASEGLFRILADTLPQMVWSTRPDGYHDYYNRRWYEFTGMPEGSTDGEAWNGMFHPDDQDRAWTRWRHSLRTGEPYEIEYRLRHRSGVYRWVLGRALPIRDEAGEIVRWFGTCTDIDEFKRTTEALRANEEFTRRILDSSGDCIKVLDLEGRLQFMSGGGLRVMEVDDFSAIEGCDWRGFWEGPDQDRARAALEVAKAGGTGRFQGFTPTLKGTPKWWDVVVTSINGADGRPERILSISRDITDSKRHEEAQELLNREMDHRIKNLFAVATSLTTLAAREATTPKELAADLRERFATLARVHSFVRMHPHDMSVRTLGELVKALLAPYHTEAGARERVRINCLGVPVGQQSTTAVALIIHELATNAAKYGALSAAEGSVEVQCSADDTTATIVWRESGGPAVRRPDSTEGFGSLLVRRSISDQLGGSLETEWNEAGVKVTITADRQRLAG